LKIACISGGDRAIAQARALLRGWKWWRAIPVAGDARRAQIYPGVDRIEMVAKVVRARIWTTKVWLDRVLRETRYPMKRNFSIKSTCFFSQGMIKTYTDVARYTESVACKPKLQSRVEAKKR